MSPTFLRDPAPRETFVLFWICRLIAGSLQPEVSVSAGDDTKTLRKAILSVFCFYLKTIRLLTVDTEEDVAAGEVIVLGTDFQLGTTNVLG